MKRDDTNLLRQRSFDSYLPGKVGGRTARFYPSERSDREIILSEAVRLEVMPRAIYEQRHEEQKAIEEIFSLASVLEWSVPVLEEAYQLACENGIAAMDAIHLAFAVKAEADELVTTEKRSKPLFRFNTSRSSPQVVSIYER